MFPPDAGRPVGEVPPDLWQPTFDQLWQLCLQRVRQRATIRYKDVVTEIPVFLTPRSKSLGVMLGRLGALPGGQALLSTVVVHSCRPGSGRGWYRKARQRGYQFPGYTCIRVCERSGTCCTARPPGCWAGSSQRWVGTAGLHAPESLGDGTRTRRVAVRSLASRSDNDAAAPHGL